MVAKRVYNSISELIIACEVIRDACKCGACPLREHCLEECTFEHIAYQAGVGDIRLCIDMADNINEESEESNKTEHDRKWEAEADYWNLRRCDPDDYE